MIPIPMELMMLGKFAGSHYRGWKGHKRKEMRKCRLRTEIAFQSRKRNRR